ncbi:MAG: hypothetical protein ACYCZN_02130 [Candidatus Dormibacteria bacterium]
MFRFRHKASGLNPIQHLATESERTIGKVNRNIKGLTVAEMGLVLLLIFLALFAVVSVVRDIIVAGCHQVAAALAFVNVQSFPTLPYWPFIALLVPLVLYLFRPWRLFRKRQYAGASFAALDFANELQARHELVAARRQKILTYILVGLTLLLAASLVFALATRHIPGSSKTSASCLLFGGTVPVSNGKYPTPPLASVSPTPLLHPSTSPTPGIAPTPSPSGSATRTPTKTSGTLPVSQSKPTPSPTPGMTPKPTPGTTPKPTPGTTPKPTPSPTPGMTPKPTPSPTPGTGGSSPGAPSPGPPALAVANTTEPVGQNDSLTVSKLAQDGDTAVLTNTKTGKAVGTCTSGAKSTSCVVQVTSTTAGSISYVATDAKTGLSSNTVTVDWTATAFSLVSQPYGADKGNGYGPMANDQIQLVATAPSNGTIVIENPQSPTPLKTCTSTTTCTVLADASTASSCIVTAGACSGNPNGIAVNYQAEWIPDPAAPQFANGGSGINVFWNYDPMPALAAPDSNPGGFTLQSNPGQTVPTWIGTRSGVVIVNLMLQPNAMGTQYCTLAPPSTLGHSNAAVPGCASQPLLGYVDTNNSGIAGTDYSTANCQLLTPTGSSVQPICLAAVPLSGITGPQSFTPYVSEDGQNYSGSTITDSVVGVSCFPVTITSAVGCNTPMAAGTNIVIGTGAGFSAPGWTTQAILNGKPLSSYPQGLPGSISLPDGTYHLYGQLLFHGVLVATTRDHPFVVGGTPITTGPPSPPLDTSISTGNTTVPVGQSAIIDITGGVANGNSVCLFANGQVMLDQYGQPWPCTFPSSSNGGYQPDSLGMSLPVTSATPGAVTYTAVQYSCVTSNSCLQDVLAQPLSEQTGNPVTINWVLPSQSPSLSIASSVSSSADYTVGAPSPVNAATTFSIWDETTGSQVGSCSISTGASQCSGVATGIAAGRNGYVAVNAALQPSNIAYATDYNITLSAPAAGIVNDQEVIVVNTGLLPSGSDLQAQVTGGSGLGSVFLSPGNYTLNVSSASPGLVPYTVDSWAQVPYFGATGTPLYGSLKASIDYTASPFTFTPATQDFVSGTGTSPAVTVTSTSADAGQTLTLTGGSGGSYAGCVLDSKGNCTIALNEPPLNLFYYGASYASDTYQVADGTQSVGSFAITWSGVLARPSASSAIWQTSKAWNTYIQNNGSAPVSFSVYSSKSTDTSVTITGPNVGGGGVNSATCALSSQLGTCDLYPPTTEPATADPVTYTVTDASGAFTTFTVTWGPPAVVSVASPYAPAVSGGADTMSFSSSLPMFANTTIDVSDNTTNAYYQCHTDSAGTCSVAVTYHSGDTGVVSYALYAYAPYYTPVGSITIDWATLLASPASAYGVAGTGSTVPVAIRSALPSDASSTLTITGSDGSTETCATSAQGVCPSDTTVAYDGVGGPVTYTVTDSAGHSATFTVTWGGSIVATPDQTVAAAQSGSSVKVAVASYYGQDASGALTITGSDGSTETCNTSAQGACSSSTAVTYDGVAGPVTYTVKDSAGHSVTFTVTWGTMSAIPSQGTMPAMYSEADNVVVTSAIGADSSATFSISAAGASYPSGSCTATNGSCAAQVYYPGSPGAVTYTATDPGGNSATFAIDWVTPANLVTLAASNVAANSGATDVATVNHFPANDYIYVDGTDGSYYSCTTNSLGSCAITLSYDNVAAGTTVTYTLGDYNGNSLSFTVTWGALGAMPSSSIAPAYSGNAVPVAVTSAVAADVGQTLTISGGDGSSVTCVVQSNGSCPSSTAVTYDGVPGVVTYTLSDPSGISSTFTVQWDQWTATPSGQDVAVGSQGSVTLASAGQLGNQYNSDIYQITATAGSWSSSDLVPSTSWQVQPSTVTTPETITYTLSVGVNHPTWTAAVWTIDYVNPAGTWSVAPAASTAVVGTQPKVVVSDANSTAATLVYVYQQGASAGSSPIDFCTTAGNAPMSCTLQDFGAINPGVATYELQTNSSYVSGADLASFTVDWIVPTGTWTAATTPNNPGLTNTVVATVTNTGGVAGVPVTVTGQSGASTCITSGSTNPSCSVTITAPQTTGFTGGMVTYNVVIGSYDGTQPLTTFTVDWGSLVATPQSASLLVGATAHDAVSIQSNYASDANAKVSVTGSDGASYSCTLSGTGQCSVNVTDTSTPGSVAYTATDVGGNTTAFVINWLSAGITISDGTGAGTVGTPDPVTVLDGFSSQGSTGITITGSDGSTYSCTALNGACGVGLTATTSGAVTYTVTDGASNSATFTVTWGSSESVTVSPGSGVSDQATAPVGTSVQLLVGSSYPQDANQIVAITSSDGLDTSCTISSGSCLVTVTASTPGNVTYTGTDPAGYTGSMVMTWMAASAPPSAMVASVGPVIGTHYIVGMYASVIITDTSSYSSQPPISIVGTDGSSYTCPWDTTGGANDVCQTQLVTASKAGSVTYTATDSSGNTTQFTIDWQAVTIVATPALATGTVGTADVVAITSNYAPDDNGTFVVTGSDGSTYSCSPSGNATCAVNIDATAAGTVTYTVKDGGGNSTTFSMTWVAATTRKSESISFSTSVPSNATVGGTYSPAATATSGLPVAITVDSASTSVCSISSGVVSFLASGTCTIDANQVGNSSYTAAPQVQQAIVVG